MGTIGNNQITIINNGALVKINGVTLDVDNWSLVDGKYEYDYTNVLIAPSSEVDVYPIEASEAVASLASFIHQNTPGSGTVKLKCSNEPTDDIIVNIRIFQSSGLTHVFSNESLLDTIIADNVHTHTNKTVIDLLTDDNGELKYNNASLPYPTMTILKNTTLVKENWAGIEGGVAYTITNAAFTEDSFVIFSIAADDEDIATTANIERVPMPSNGTMSITADLEPSDNVVCNIVVFTNPAIIVV